MKKQKFIWITFQREGIHQYPNAPDEVAFLKHPHRHIFHFKVEMEVYHDDRDVEFIMLKRELENLYSTNTLKLFNMSCEMICDEIANYLKPRYLNRDLVITVSEDGENGSTCYYPKDEL